MCNMCNSAEQSGVEIDSKRENGFTSESDLPFAPATTADGNVEDNSNDTSVKNICNSGQSSLVDDSCCQKILRTLQDLPETLEQSCIVNLADSKDDVNASSMENGMMDTPSINKEIVSKTMCSETETDAIHEVELKKEDFQGTREELTADFTLSPTISSGYSGQTPSKVVEVPTIVLVPGEKDCAAQAAKEAATDMYKRAKESEMQEITQHSDDTEVDYSLVVELVEESVCHSTGLCTVLEQENISSKHNALILQEADRSNERMAKSPRESLTWIEERHSKRDEMTDQPVATSHITSASESMQILDTCEETDINIATCIAEGSQVVIEQIESTAPESGQGLKEPVVIEDKGKLTPDMALSSEEIPKEHVSESLKEPNPDSSIEMEQQDFNVPSAPLQVPHSSYSKGNNGPELAEFFSNARGSKHEVEIEEQDHVPIRIESPPKRKSLMESPRSLRMLLFSEETALFTKKDEKHKKDGKGMEFSNKVAPASEGIGNESHNEDNFPNWLENADGVEASNAFSGPLAFSGALTYQGMISYTGSVAYSGSISHRSDSSTSTRSFAFPILASDWNTSPVKMGAPDPRFFRQQRKWHLRFCCRRPSTLFD